MEINELQESNAVLEDLTNQCENEERNLEMMISGGDYSPNSHTFMKQPGLIKNESIDQ